MKRPWTLLISPVVPDVNGTGIHRRAWMWAEELARSANLVTLVINADLTYSGAPNTLPGRTLVVTPDARSVRWWRRFTWRTFMPVGLREVLRDLPDDPPSRLIIFRLKVLPVIDRLPRHWFAQLEIDLDDWDSEAHRSFIWMALRHGHWRESARYLQFYGLSRIKERIAVSLARVIHLAAAEDAAEFARRHPRAQVNVVPNRIAPLSKVWPVTRGRHSASLLFVGSLGYLPNTDAIYWFVRRLLPRLMKTHPQATLCVVGDATGELARFLRAAPLVWMGRLDDLSEVYAQSDIAIAPLRGGSGTKFKVLEGWLHHRAVVATTHAVRGLGVVSGVHALVADSDEDFVAACRLLLDDESLRERIAEAGYRLVREKFVL